MNKTYSAKPADVTRKWYIIDADSLVLGRLTTRLSNLLMGKGKPLYAPSQDHGDYVIVINADKIRLTGKKEDAKSYFHHTGHPGGGRERSFKKQIELDATKVIRLAVKGMLPKSVLGNAIIKKIFIYNDAKHPHGAQKPEPVTI